MGFQKISEIAWSLSQLRYSGDWDYLAHPLPYSFSMKGTYTMLRFAIASLVIMIVAICFFGNVMKNAHAHKANQVDAVEQFMSAPSNN